MTMSVTKLLGRIVAPTDITSDIDDAMGTAQEDKYKKQMAATLHDHTYGITSDPLTQFACAFSALIHDVGKSCPSCPSQVVRCIPRV